MCGGVDPACHTRDHDQSALPEFRGQFTRKPPAIRRGVARPDDSDHRPLEQLGFAEDGQDRGRVLDSRQRARIIRLAPADESCLSAANCRELGLGLGA